MLTNRIKLLVAAFGLITLSMLPVYGQSTNQELLNKRVTINLADKPVFDIFRRLIYEYDVAIGFEQSDLDGDHDHDDYFFETNVPFGESNTVMVNGHKTGLSGGRPLIVAHLLSINYQNARLEDVLNEVVRQMKNYMWVINDGVVNIYPALGRNPIMEKLMAMNVRIFSVPKDAEVGWINSFIISGLPEFKDFVASNGITPTGNKTAPWYDDRPLPEGLKFSNLSFQGLLNAIVKTKRGGWIIRPYKRAENGREKEYFNILL